YALRRVLTTVPDRERNRTEVTLEPIQRFYRRVADVTRLLLRAELDKAPPKPGDPLPKKVSDLHALHQAVLLGAPRTQVMHLGDAVPAIKIVQLAKDVAAADAARHLETIVDRPHTLGELATPLLKPRAIPPASQWQFS